MISESAIGAAGRLAVGPQARGEPSRRGRGPLAGRLEFGPPKSEAGKRTVVLPAAAMEALRIHLVDHVGADSESLVFTGDQGAPLRVSNFRRAVKWSAAIVKAGLPAGFTFHDLRHTGNNLAAASGASTRELMHRMGHSSMRAAL